MSDKSKGTEMMADLVSRLLHRVSWQAEKLFRARGWLRTMVWCSETKNGRRQLFETACEAERAEISDDEALAALCADPGLPRWGRLSWRRQRVLVR